MNKAIKVLLAVAVFGSVVYAASQKVELTRKYEFGPFNVNSTATNVMTFTLPQELKAVIVTVCSLNATSAVDVARSPLETQYKAGFGSTTNTVDLWYPTGLLTASAGTNSLYVPNIKEGLIIKGSRSLAGGTNSAFRIAITAITLQ